MDIQMPRMDGLTATKIIRAANTRIPIIAMTAQALERDRQKCLDAGMNDYLSKPINIPHVAAVLAKWLQ
jgi:CheY-like chemotaxis protein